MSSLIAIDSNALTYLIEAMEPGYDPATDDPTLAVERVAMIRSYIYGAVQFWVMPTVETEYDQIRIPAKRLRHQKSAWLLLHDAPLHSPPTAIARRAAQLAPLHADANDCRVVAEAEASGVPALVTRDDDLIDHLSGHTRLALQYPAAFWRSLGIGWGAQPRLEPKPPSLLAHVSWWRL